MLQLLYKDFFTKSKMRKSVIQIFIKKNMHALIPHFLTSEYKRSIMNGGSTMP